MNAFLWAIVLLLCGLTLMCFELFVPSAGMLGILSALTILASVAVVFYHEGLGAGTLYLVGVAFVVGLALVKGLQWWPRTSIGKRILNLPPDRDTDMQWNLAPFDFLMGHIGLAKSKMLPSGMILVDGETYDAVSIGGPLDVGDAIQVVDVQGNRILIRPHEVSLPMAEPPDSKAPDHNASDPRLPGFQVSDPGDPQPDGPTPEIATPETATPETAAERTDATGPAPDADLLFPDPFDESSSDKPLP